VPRTCCLDPGRVPIVNAACMPSDENLRMRKVVAPDQEAQAAG
jgi:citrate lyase beta subunit